MCAVPVGLKSSAEPRNDQVRTNRGNENSNKQPVHFEAPPKLSIPQTQADALLQNFVSAIEVNAGCGPPAARGRSRPASPCRPAQRSWRTPTQDHALAPGRAWARPMPWSRTREQAEGGWTAARAWSRHMAAQEDAALNHYSATSRRCASVSSAALTLCRQSKRKELSHATRTFQKLFGNEGGSTGLDDDFVARGFEHGSWAATLFGPIRGPWPDDNWKGWWGDEATYHCPVFVLTHHARPSI